MGANPKDEKDPRRAAAVERARAAFKERKRAEEAVRATRELALQSELLRVTLASIGDGVATTDPENRVAMLNPVAEALTGWTQEEARDRPFAEIFRTIHEATRAPVEDPAAQALRERRAVALANHTLLIARDGSEVPVDDSAAPIRDEQGTVFGAVVVFRSIAERKRAEETRARLAAIVESSQDAIISKALDTRVQSWNAAAEELFGYRAAEMIGRSITRLIPPERQDEERIILDRIRRGERVENYETVRVAKDGRRVDVSLTVSPVRDGAGRIVGASKIVRDVTARKQAEEALRQVAMENAMLLDRLREADRRKDEFLAMLAHELRNPLTSIHNASLVLRARGPSGPELPRAADVIDRQVRQMTRLVDDLIDVSRITRGQIALRKEVVELADVVKAAVEASRPVIDRRSHELTVTLPSEPIRLVADPIRLAQVVSNLLTNAAKYTDPDGHIRVTAERREREVALRIRDDGIGIAAEALPRIFEPFTQLPGSFERSEGGLGVGLTLVRRLVELHGGTVEARSDGPGMGSEFIARLPCEADGDFGRARADGDARASPRRRVLVVDDDRDAADSLGMLLDVGGHEVRVAHDGVEGVELAAGFRPEVVLLDLGLPKLSGYEVARRIRALEEGSQILLVALTGWGQDEDRLRSAEAGFDHHLTKPVEIDELARLLAQPLPRRA